MLGDLVLSALWWIVSALLFDDSLLSPEFLTLYRDAMQGLGPVIEAIGPLTVVVPFGAMGIVLNFVIITWLLGWPVRIVVWLLGWLRGKASSS